MDFMCQLHFFFPLVHVECRTMSRRSSSFAPAVHLETASPDVTAGHAGPPDEGGRDGQGAPWFFFIN